MHPAEEYLRNPQNNTSLYVIIDGKKRRLFINRSTNQIGIIAPKKKNKGFLFTDWNSIEKVIHQTDLEQDAQDLKNTAKYKKMAASASFTNGFIRKCLSADLNKSPYENKLTTGTSIDGKIISFKSLERWYPLMNEFRKAIKERKSYRSGRFNYMGYDGSLAVEPKENGDVGIFFNKEYRNCGNGYYYLAINDENFIGYDID